MEETDTSALVAELRRPVWSVSAIETWMSAKRANDCNPSALEDALPALSMRAWNM